MEKLLLKEGHLQIQGLFVRRQTFDATVSMMKNHHDVEERDRRLYNFNEPATQASVVIPSASATLASLVFDERKRTSGMR